MQEYATSQERSRWAAMASGAELVGKCAKFSCASVVLTAGRNRLEKYTVSAPEAHDIGSDTDWVLEAPASSEKERWQLWSQLDRRPRVMVGAYRAMGVAEGMVVHLQGGVNIERAELSIRRIVSLRYGAGWRVQIEGITGSLSRAARETGTSLESARG